MRFTLIMLFALSLANCGFFVAPINRPAPPPADQRIGFEVTAWKDLASLLTSMDVAPAWQVGEDSHGVVVGGRSAATGSPAACMERMTAELGATVHFESVPETLDLIEESFRAEGVEKIFAVSAASRAADLRKGAVQAAVIAVLFHVADGHWPSRALAARSLALEALARSRGAPPDAHLTALQSLALGRPDEALKFIGADSRPASEALRAYLTTDPDSVSGVSAYATTLRILARIRDHRPISMADRESWLAAAPGARFIPILLVNHVDVTLGHSLSIGAVEGAAAAALNVLGIETSRETASGDRPEDNAERLVGILEGLIAAGGIESLEENSIMLYGKARGSASDSEPLRLALADGWMKMGLLARFDFLKERYGSDDAAAAFAHEAARALGKDHPVVRYMLARRILSSDEAREDYLAAILALPDETRWAKACALLYPVSRADALVIYNRLQSLPIDSDIVTLRRLALLSFSPFCFQNKYLHFIDRAMAIDPFDPAVVTHLEEESFEAARSGLPRSCAVMYDVVQRIGERLVAERGEVEEGLEILGALARMMPDEPNPHWSMAHSFAWLGRKEEALAAWRTWLALHARQAGLESISIEEAAAAGQAVRGGGAQAGSLQDALVGKTDLAVSHVLSWIGALMYEFGDDQRGLGLLEAGSWSYAESCLDNYAEALAAHGDIEKATLMYRNASDRYGRLATLKYARQLDRTGRGNEAEKVLTAFFQERRADGLTRDKVMEFMMMRYRSRLGWLYASGIYDRRTAWDDGSLAVARLMERGPAAAREILREGEVAGRLNPTTIWFHYALILENEGEEEAEKYLRSRESKLSDPPYHRTLLRMVRMKMDPDSIVHDFDRSSYRAPFVTHVYPLASIVARSRGDAVAAERWLDVSLRLKHQAWYLPILARHLAKHDVGGYWAIHPERYRRRTARGLECS